MSKKITCIISVIAVIVLCGYLLFPTENKLSQPDAVNNGETRTEADEKYSKNLENNGIDGVTLTSENTVADSEAGTSAATAATGEILPEDFPFDGMTTSASINIELVSKIAFKASAVRCDGSAVEVSSVHTTPNAMFAVNFKTSNPTTAEAISFYVDASANTKKSLLKVNVRAGGNTELAAGSVYYLVSGSHIYRYVHNVNRTVEIPEGFSGRVIIPLDNVVYEEDQSLIDKSKIEGIGIQYQSVERNSAKTMVYSQFRYYFNIKEGDETFDNSRIITTVVDKNGFPYYNVSSDLVDDLDTSNNISPVGLYTASQGKAHDGRLTMRQNHNGNESGVFVKLPISSVGYDALSVEVDNTENTDEQWITFGLNSGAGDAYIGNESTVYMIDRSGSYIKYENKQYTSAIRIPGGFKGTVVLPFSQFTLKSSGNQVPKNNITGLLVILRNVTYSTQNRIYLDNLRLYLGANEAGQVTEYNIKFAGYATRTLCDFTSMPGTSTWNGIETSALSLSGGALKINLSHTSNSATVAITHGGDAENAMAVMFTVDTTELSEASQLKPMLTTTANNSYAQMRADAVYYLYKDGKYFSSTPGSNNSVVIPGGGKYTVIIPFDDMTVSGGNTLSAEDLAISLYLQLQNITKDPSKNIYIDDIKYVIDENPKAGSIEVVPMGGGGYVIGILIHPADPELKYIRTDVGGVYKWDPDNNRWNQLSDYFEDNYKQYCTDGFALDPRDKNVLYICVGNGTGSGTSGIYKSTDQGESFTLVKGTLFLGNSTHRECGECIMVDPNDSNIVYCGVRGGLMVSKNAGSTWSNVDAIPNNYSYPSAPYGIRCVAIDERSVVDGHSKNIYVSAYSQGIYRSTDGGTTWNLISGCPTTPKIMRVASDGTLYVTSDDGMWKFKSNTWTDITPEGAKRSFNALAVDPADPKRVIMARAIVGDECMNLPIYYTTDGGTTWTTKGSNKRKMDKLQWWPDYYFSSDTAALIFNPGNTKEVWMTDWYGVWMTYNIDDTTVDWYLKVKGHEEAVTFCQTSLPAGPVKYILGTVDNGALYYTDIEKYPVKRGNGDCCDLAYCVAQPNYVVQTNAGAAIQISTDYGVSYTSKTVKSGLKINTVAISATDPKNIVVLANGGSPWYTKDGGSTWAQSTGAPNNSMTDKWSRAYILRADGGNGNVFYYAGSDGIYVSTDGGQSFTRKNTSITGSPRIYTAPGKEGWVYTIVGSKIYYSQDSGATFTTLNSISGVECFSFGIGKTAGTLAFYAVGTVGGKAGLYISDDNGATWTMMQPKSKLSLYGNVTGDMQSYGRCYMVCGGLGAIVIYK